MSLDSGVGNVAREDSLCRGVMPQSFVYAGHEIREAEGFGVGYHRGRELTRFIRLDGFGAKTFRAEGL